ncbi:MAG: hypothetical protein IJP90_08940 [Treponema sp.]|nr:hypothetical protein [Treponema sp.]
MNINKLLNEVKNRTFSLEKNTSEVKDNLKELLDKETSGQDFFYVGINQFVLDYYKDNPNSKWKIKYIFQLGFPFLFFNSETNNNLDKAIIRAILKDKYWCLFVFTKEENQKVIIGFNDCERYSFKYDGFSISDYPEYGNDYYYGRPIPKKDEHYEFYYEKINYIIESNKTPELTEEMHSHYSISFNCIPSENFFLKYLDYLSRYKKSVIEEFGLPTKEEKLLHLKNLAQIVFQGQNEKSNAYKERDIITNGLFIDEYSCSVYGIIKIANKTDNDKYNFILRSFTLSPYYIWALLSSEFTQDHCLATIEYYDFDPEPIPIDTFICFVPETINESFFKKKYELTKQTKFSMHKKLENPNNKSVFFNNNVEQIILKDLDELRKCFSVGAYKAAIILAGSILEAFLIDWLSDIHKRNYFEEDYQIFDKYRNQERRADLKDYIDAIQELKKPSWFDAARKATEIRKKRNLIHAKLYINDDDISKETCTQVIDYLEYVINTRWRLKG